MGQWALKFTPCVAIAGRNRDVLLLEVQASLRLWGGPARLIGLLEEQWETFGWHAPDEVRMASAPSANAAWWLAADCHGPAALAMTDLSVIEEAQPHLNVLQRMGIRTLGQLEALPRAGLAKRFGKELLIAIDAARNRIAQPQQWITAPETFATRRELHMRAENTAPIEAVLTQCFHELCAWLHARQRGVDSLAIQLHHDEPPHTTITLRFAGATRDSERFGRLLSEQLAKVSLKNPVYEVSLFANETASLPHATEDFWGNASDSQQALQALIERLQARLGPDEVQQLQLVDEHRPEHATRLAPLNEKSATHPNAETATAHRPAWLLHTPIALRVSQHRPNYRGPLQLLAGPERIEAGWWDDSPQGPAQRDYFIARASNNSLLWVFRTPAHDWYLHGFFS
jgi:protein ImuB